MEQTWAVDSLTWSHSTPPVWFPPKLLIPSILRGLKIYNLPGLFWEFREKMEHVGLKSTRCDLDVQERQIFIFNNGIIICLWALNLPKADKKF